MPTASACEIPNNVIAARNDFLPFYPPPPTTRMPKLPAIQPSGLPPLPIDDDEPRPLLLSGIIESPTLHAFRYGMMMVTPLLLAATLGTLINNFPLQAYQDLMLSLFGEGWKKPGELIFSSTIQVLALAVAFSLSDCLISLHNKKHPSRTLDPTACVLTAFSSLFIMLNPQVGSGELTLEWLGIRGLFGTLVVVFFACKLFLFLCSLRRLRAPFYAEGADPAISQIFDILLPVLLTLGFFVVFRMLLSYMGIESLHQILYAALQAPFSHTQDNFVLGIFYTLTVHIGWFFGIHGPELLNPVVHDIFTLAPLFSDRVVDAAGQAQIFSENFFVVYIFIGGCGTTLGLLLAIALQSKNRGTRKIALLSALPGIFNINELLIFGLPIVLNPVLLIPFLLVPLTLFLLSYFAVAHGFAPLPLVSVDWTTPPIISGYLSTGSWRGVALQLINIGIATALYMPFIRMDDMVKLSTRKKSFYDLIRTVQTGARDLGGKFFIDRTGGLGALARSLAGDMSHAFDHNDGTLKLLFQPRVNFVEKTVPCVEAKIHWDHPVYGSIPTPLIHAIAVDLERTAQLDHFLLTQVFDQQAEWRDNGLFTTVAINLSEHQLQNKKLPALLDYLHTSKNLPSDAILLEVKEHLILDPEAQYLLELKALHAVGATLAVTGFGKGYQSMGYLKRLPLAELQVNRTLIKDIAINSTSQEVLGSIQQQCNKLGIKTSVEWLETYAQLETLLELNFTTFQGRYFSPPVSATACRNFILTFTKK